MTVVETAPTPGAGDRGPRRNALRLITAIALIAVAAVLGAMPRRLDGRSRSIILRQYELHSWRSELEELRGLALLHVPPASSSRRTQLAKRLVDVVGSALAVLLTLPVGLALAGRNPAERPRADILPQQRSDHDGRPFRMSKFWTMPPPCGGYRSCSAARSTPFGWNPLSRSISPSPEISRWHPRRWASTLCSMNHR